MAAGGKLVPEEEAKRARNPLDRYDEIAARAAEGRSPKGLDVFMIKYQGLFYVAPAQDSFMVRMRMPGGILSAAQYRGVADLSDERGGGYADITTRANLQVREIGAASAPEVLWRPPELGLTSRGAGADNVRNVTGSPTAGIDPQELIDSRPHARAIHRHILHHRELYGPPRKFNIGFEGGGRVAVLDDTNDIAFTAVALAGGVSYRLALGGITVHRDLARGTGVLVLPAEPTAACDAVLRVFIAHGDRTARRKARLKYLLDRWGLPRFLDEVETVLGRKLLRVDEAERLPRPAQDKHDHVGVHPQRHAGRLYVGITCPVGRLTAEQMRVLADVAQAFGSGTIRLTVWQNLFLSDIPEERIGEALDVLAGLGLGWEASHLRGGLAACTGNSGCKFAASDTKGARRPAGGLAGATDRREPAGQHPPRRLPQRLRAAYGRRHRAARRQGGAE